MAEFWVAFIEFIRWLQTVLTTSDITYLVALIGLIAALFPFYKKVANFVYKNYLEPVGKFFATFATLPDRLQALESKMDEKVKILRELQANDISEIKKELTPNSGSSIKDQVSKLTEGVEHIAQTMDGLASQTARMELRQQSILHSVRVPTFETDRNGNCTFANKAYLDLAGRTMEQVRGPGWVNIIHPNDRKKVREEWESAVADNRDFEMTFRIVNEDKMIYEVTCIAEPLSGNGYIGKYETVTPLGSTTSTIIL